MKEMQGNAIAPVKIRGLKYNLNTTEIKVLLNNYVMSSMFISRDSSRGRSSSQLSRTEIEKE